jgi:Uma2 family endonuclease
MSSVTQQLLTAHDLRLLPETGIRRELVRGEVVEDMPPGGRHGAIAALLAMLLQLWIKQTIRGYVGVESGFVLAQDPDTVRAPDVSYVRADRIPPDGIPDSYWELAPDLAVEIVSPHETADEVRAKVRDFLAAGTPLVWVIYPRSQEVIAHTPDGLARTYQAEDVLEHPAVLPGFVCQVAELFV